MLQKFHQRNPAVLAKAAAEAANVNSTPGTGLSSSGTDSNGSVWKDEEIFPWLFNKYGPTLDMAALADVFHNTIGTLDNKIRSGDCPIPTYREGGHRVADIRDVATYLNHRRREALIAHQKQQERLSAPNPA